MTEIDLMSSSQEDHIFALCYGASGSGKTHLMGTLGELGRVLIIDIDKGYKTLKFAQDLQKFKKNLSVTTFDKFGDLDKAYQVASKNDPAMWTKTLGFQVTQPFDWLVWDTWSELQWSMLQELRKDKNISGGGKLAFRDNLQIQHWGAMTDLNKLAIEALRDCPINQVITMQETMMKDDVTGLIYGGPAIHGKMVQEMPAYFDEVIHTYTDPSGMFCATTKMKSRWPAKSRIKGPQDLKNPTAKQFFTVA